MPRIPKSLDIPPPPDIPLTKLSRATQSLREHVDMLNPEYLSALDDRVLAIIDSAILEQKLEQALSGRMGHLSKLEQDTLFIGERATLGTFAAKIKIGYAFSLFGKRTRDELERIKSIRNQFAHAAKPINFETKAVRDECQKLASTARVARPHFSLYPKNARWPPDSAKMRYHFSTLLLSSGLTWIGEPPSGFPEISEMDLPLD